FVHFLAAQSTCFAYATLFRSVRTMKNRPILQVFCGLALAASTTFAASSSAQTAGHSPGWVVLPVEEYRTLHERAYPIERETEPRSEEHTSELQSHLNLVCRLL